MHIRVNPWLYSRLLLRFDVHVLGVDHPFVFLLAPAIRTRLRSSARTCARARLRSARGLSRFVHLLSQLVRGGSQAFARLVHLPLVVRLERLLGISQSVFDISAFRAGDLIAVLAQHLLDVVDHRVELVLGLDRLARCLVFGRVRVGFFRHALDLVLRQARR